MRVTNGDPFAALDSKPGKQGEADELSSRFPTLDQFSLLHEQGAKFEFDSPTSPALDKKGFNQNVTDRLADDAFAGSRPRPDPAQPSGRQSSDYNRVRAAAGGAGRQDLSPPPGTVNKPGSAPPPSEMSRASAIISSNPELQAISSPPPKSIAQTPPSKPAMVSTGTMTGTPPLAIRPLQDFTHTQRFHPTDQHRSSSLPRQQDPSGTGQYQMETTSSSRPAGTPRLASLRPSHGRHSSSTRPSLEGGRPSLDILEPLSKSTSGRPRPASTYLESNLDYLREREAAPRPLRSPGLPSTRFPETVTSPGLDPQEDTAIESNVDFLRSMEDTDPKRKEKSHKHHGKRPSLGSLSGTKNILAGKFGDAFKRFEGNQNPAPLRTPSPLKELDRHELTPIAGSEATDGRSDDGHGFGEPEMTPEMRRELEAQSLAEEERRVEAAAAEYRQRVAAREAGDPSASGASAPLPKSIGGVSRAVSIQNRVQNLLDESQKSSVQKTASGYGKFTDSAVTEDDADEGPGLPPRPAAHGTGTDVGRAASSSFAGSARPVTAVSSGSMEANITAAAAAAVTRGCPASTAPPDTTGERRPPLPARPQPAPKPTHLNNIPTGGSRARSPSKTHRPPPPSSSSTSVASTAALSSSSGGVGGGGPRMSAEQLIALDLPGQPPGQTATLLEMSPREKDDYVRDFSKRFPSLNAIEMVERDLNLESAGGSGGGGGGADRNSGR